MHMPPSAVPKTSKRQRKAQERIRKQAKPVYMLSDDDVDKWGFAEILLHCNDFSFLSKPSASLPWKRMHSWIILHNNSLMLTPQVSLSKWLNHFNWGCSWHAGTGNVILQNSSCHNVSLIIIFKNIGPLRVLLSDLLLLLYRRRIFSLLFFETLEGKEFKIIFSWCHDQYLLYQEDTLYSATHKILAINDWHTSIVSLLTIYCTGFHPDDVNPRPLWKFKPTTQSHNYC